MKKHRKRKQPRPLLQFPVVGGNGCAPSPSAVGVQRVKKWLEDEWDQLEVSLEESLKPFMLRAIPLGY